MFARSAVEAALLALAWAAALAVRPWRLLRAGGAPTPLVMPTLACLVLVPWLWSWPALAAMPVPLHWSAAPLVVLLLGWPLAVGCLSVAGPVATLANGLGWAEGLSLTVWSGLLPATLALGLGHAVRKACGPHPLGYLFGRAFFVPLLVMAACGCAACAWPHRGGAADADMQIVTALLLAVGEASWTCALATLLVACRPQWLATWSDALYLPRPATSRAGR